MFRILGFITGSLTSIAIILLVTGLPTFHLEDPEINQQRFDAAVEKLMARKVDAEQSAEQAAEGHVQDAVAMQDKTESMHAGTAVHDDTLSPHAAQAVSSADATVAQAEIENIADIDTTQPIESARWYSFWNPFRSQIAANGFVSQLEKVTGIDYRVVKIKSGVYEVAFAYGNDTERRDKLAQISAATGLDLPDS